MDNVLKFILHICTVIKKLLILCLAVFYLGVASGATLHYQYCMGRLVKVSFWHHHTEKCQTCGMHKQDKAAGKCCTDKHQQLKSENSNALAGIFTNLQAPVALLPVQLAYWFTSVQTQVAVAQPVANSPPPLLPIPAFILNCTYRI